MRASSNHNKEHGDEAISLNYNSVAGSDELKLTFDEILDKIGYTRFHILMFAIVGLSLISDGVELYLIYLISPILQQIYNLTDNKISMVISSLFLGIGIGAILTGIIINRYGRKKTMLFFLSLITIFGTFCVLIDNIYWFLFCRLIIGISIGVLFNLTNAIREILPSKNRDFLMGSIYFYVKIGTVYFILVYYLFILNQDPLQNYKLIIIFSSIPMYICLILAFLFYEESPRILFLSKETIEEGFKVIDKMAKGSEFRLTQNHRKSLLKQLISNLESKQFTEFKQAGLMRTMFTLFTKKYIKLFLLVILIWVLNILVIITNIYSLPIILNKLEIQNNGNVPILHNKNTLKGGNILNLEFNLNSTDISDWNRTNLSNISTPYLNNSNQSHIITKESEVKKILISAIIPIPGEFIAGILTSIPSLGRKNTMICGFVFQIIFSLLMIYHSEYYYIYSSMIVFFNTFSFNIGKLYTCEAFNTSLRDTAFSISNFCSRIASVFIPFMVNFAMLYSIYGPCYLILILCCFGLFICLSLPFDTYNRKLDSYVHVEESKSKNFQLK